MKPEPSYKPPDFNELVDDSSNELEIDMSEAASDKNEAAKDKDVVKDEASPTVYHPFSRPVATTASPFSSNSAFRPPQTKSSTLTNLGPYPAEATFVGYPSEPPATAAVAAADAKPPLPVKSDDSQSDASVCSNAGVKSPETVNKQYTILQVRNFFSDLANLVLCLVSPECVRC